jgi:uncharacterized protein (TIGR00269 family)
MKCRKCGGKAVVNLREHRLSLCKGCYIPWFVDYTEKTIKKFRMIDRGDRVLVAVSGGKDSLALWDVLNELGYETFGLYIHLGIDYDSYSDVSLQKSKQFAERIGRELVVVDVEKEIGAGIPELRGITRRPVCSVCGMTKRYYMNRIAIELGASVLATGHNLDDEVSQLLGNVLNWNMDYLIQQSPVLPAKEEGLKKKVKPFCYFTEKQTLLYTLLRNIDYVEMECPFSVGATSIFNKDILNQLEHRSPGIKRRFYDGFLNNKHLFLKDVVNAISLKNCSNCGMPTVNEVCSFCKTRERVRSVVQ